MSRITNSGLLVRTKSGKEGKVYNSSGKINGKIPVYLDTKQENIKPVLCFEFDLEIIGFFD